MTAAAEVAPTVGRRRDWFGQPAGLTVLFMTDTWEMFSYYGMRTILVLYMTKGLGFPQSKASWVYGLYTGLVYMTPLIGGPLADRWLGRTRAVLIGGSVMALGHFMMAFPPLLYAALATIALGNGLFFPSLPAQVPGLYADGDPRAKGAMNIYYLGVNVGATAAPLLCGTLGELYGWHYGFGAAGVGMVVAMMIYVAGRRHLHTMPPHEWVRSERALDASGRQRFLLMLGVVATIVLFRAAYEQVGNTVALWSDAGVDRRFGSSLIPATWFITLNPVLVLVLTPFLVRGWARQAERGREPSTIRKMAIGAAGVAAAYGLLAVASATAGPGGHAHWLWLAGFYVVLTASELYILPVGLGLFSRIAPKGFAATAVAVWFSASFIGNFGAGVLGSLFERTTPAIFFSAIALVALTPAALLLMFDRRVRAAEHDPGSKAEVA